MPIEVSIRGWSKSLVILLTDDAPTNKVNTLNTQVADNPAPPFWQVLMDRAEAFNAKVTSGPHWSNKKIASVVCGSVAAFFLILILVMNFL